MSAENRFKNAIPRKAKPKNQKTAHDHYQTQAKTLVDIGLGCELFNNQDGDSFAVCAFDKHLETLPLESKDFRVWLAFEYFKMENKPPGEQAIRDALLVLTGRAKGNPIQNTFLRIGESAGFIYIDLCDAKFSQVEIKPGAWSILNDNPVKFVRPKGMMALPVPATGGALKLLRPFLNVSNADWLMVCGFLLGCFRSKGPYPVLVVQGEQGTAKTTFLKTLRRFIDPSIAPARSAPDDLKAFAVEARNTWLIAYDNLSFIPSWLSDALCCLSTEGGMVARKLYTDSDISILNAQRPVVLNGIEEIITREDLRDRSIFLNLEVIDQAQRRDLKTLEFDLEAVAPAIMGGICDTLAFGLQVMQDGLKLENLPRLADFALWVSACEMNLGFPVRSFITAYESNRSISVLNAVEQNPLASAIERLSERERFHGSFSELLHELNLLVDDDIKKSKSWPALPNQLSNRLRRIAPILRASGIGIEFSREGHTSKRVVAIRRADALGNDFKINE